MCIVKDDFVCFVAFVEVFRRSFATNFAQNRVPVVGKLNIYTIGDGSWSLQTWASARISLTGMGYRDLPTPEGREQKQN